MAVRSDDFVPPIIKIIAL